MGIEASHVFADGDIDYIENLNNIREEVVDLANGVNDSTIRLTNSGSNRWVFSRNGTESGSNAGSDLHLASYDDSGVLIGVRLAVDRSTGNLMIGTTTDDGSNKLQVAGNTALTGNLTFSGNGRRIIGDFSNGTASSRTILQTSTTNGDTYVNAAPNGTSRISRFTVNNNSDVNNTSVTSLSIDANRGVISTSIRGTGSVVPLAFDVNDIECGRVLGGGRWYFGTTAVDDGVSIVRVGGNLTAVGNITLAGTGRRITGDFTNATASLRTIFQSSSTDSATLVGAAPSGSATTSNFSVNNKNDVDNASFLALAINPTEASLNSSVRGTGTQLPIVFQINTVSYGSLFTTGRWYFGSSPTDDGVSTLAVGGAFSTTGNIGLSGNLNFTGSARRITGDMSGGTIANRVAFQTSVGNSATYVTSLPAGTATDSAFMSFGNSNPTDAHWAGIGATASSTYLRSGITGTGTLQPLNFMMGVTTYASMFTTGRWFFGSSPTDDGVSTLAVGGAFAATGNITLNGTARRIVANFSDGTSANRCAFQTSTTNGATVVGVIPNGTGTQSIVRVINSSGYTNGSTGSLSISSAAVAIDCGFIGSGSALPLDLSVNGTSQYRLFTSGRHFFGPSASDNGTDRVQVSGSVIATGYKASSPSVGVGYSTGAGGTVTQLTSKSTAVTLNTACGDITMHNASLAANTAVSFTLNNSSIAATDVVIVNIRSGATAGAYTVNVDAKGAGTCQISLRNLTAGALGEAVVISFVVIKSVTA